MKQRRQSPQDTRIACSICQQPIDVQFGGWRFGHNAAPINEGRCCDICNDTIVIPARLTLIYAPQR